VVPVHGPSCGNIHADGVEAVLGTISLEHRRDDNERGRHGEELHGEDPDLLDLWDGNGDGGIAGGRGAAEPVQELPSSSEHRLQLVRAILLQRSVERQVHDNDRFGMRKGVRLA